MSISAIWFAMLGAAGIALFLLGRRLGAGQLGRVVGLLTLFILLIFACLWIQNNPALALHFVPSRWLVYLEGTAKFLPAMAVLGLAWTHGAHLRQRILTGAAVAIACGCFLHDGRWMLQSMPVLTGGPDAQQSEDYTCVAAACATALNELNIPASEEQMARFAQVRHGSGATPLRAVDGLTRRLSGTGVTVRLADLTFDQLRGQAMPALALFQFEPGQMHMVTVLSVQRGGAQIIDPVDGAFFFPRDAFERHCRGPIITFDRVAPARVALAK